MSKQRQAKKKGSKELILKQSEYAVFVKWMATPDALREPKTQEELAKQLGVDVATLSKWKNTDHYWPDVEAEIKKWMKDRTQNVVGKLYSRILKEGKSNEVKLFLQYGAGFSEKVQVEDKSLKELAVIGNALRAIATKKK